MKIEIGDRRDDAGFPQRRERPAGAWASKLRRCSRPRTGPLAARQRPGAVQRRDAPLSAALR
jgi:hypothetical protein